MLDTQRAARLDLPVRMRRLRRSEPLRRMLRETRLDPAALIYPIFVVHGRDVRDPIASMPGQARLSVDQLPAEAAALRRLGIGAVLLFGIPAAKDAVGSEAYAADGIVQRAVQTLKDADPDLVVITDVCLCEYTDHGHCGLLSAGGEVLNDPTVELLVGTALSHTQAGADIVAPSDMMDGRVGAIRRALDADGHLDTAILAYAAKFASAFYGPFREAAGSTPSLGDRRGYQMDPANAREALREIALDVEEGADLIMVKPALAYLDVIRRARDTFPHPLAAYNVSGEYAMLKAAVAQGWMDEERAVMETMTAIRRAGADLILTYFAKDVGRWLQQTP